MCDAFVAILTLFILALAISGFFEIPRSWFRPKKSDGSNSTSTET